MRGVLLLLVMATSIWVLWLAGVDAHRRGRNGLAWALGILCAGPFGLAAFALVWVSDLRNGRVGLIDPRGLPRLLQVSYCVAAAAILSAGWLSMTGLSVRVDPLPPPPPGVSATGLPGPTYACGSALNLATSDSLGEFWLSPELTREYAGVQLQHNTTRARCQAEAATRLGLSVMLLFLGVVVNVAASHSVVRATRRPEPAADLDAVV